MHNGPSKQIQKENIMKVLKMLFVVSVALLLFSSAALAGDFDWIRDFNIKAATDPYGPMWIPGKAFNSF